MFKKVWKINGWLAIMIVAAVLLAPLVPMVSAETGKIYLNMAKSKNYQFNDVDGLWFRYEADDSLVEVVEYYFTSDNRAIYCIEPSNIYMGLGEQNEYSTSTERNDSTTGKTFNAEQEALLAYVLAYGERAWKGATYKDGNNTYVHEDLDDQVATQMAVWIVATGNYKDTALLDKLLPVDGGMGAAPNPEISKTARELLEKAESNYKTSQIINNFNGVYPMEWDPESNAYVTTIVDDLGALNLGQDMKKMVEDATDAFNKKNGTELKVSVEKDEDGRWVIEISNNPGINGSLVVDMEGDMLLTKSELVYMYGIGPITKQDDVRYQDMVTVKTVAEPHSLKLIIQFKHTPTTTVPTSETTVPTPPSETTESTPPTSSEQTNPTETNCETTETTKPQAVAITTEAPPLSHGPLTGDNISLYMIVFVVAVSIVGIYFGMPEKRRDRRRDGN